MKIKADFVTNSSSSCFVVFVPDSYKLSDQVLKKCIAENIEWWDQTEEEETTIDEYVELMRGDVIDCIEKLKQGNDVYKDDYGGDGIDYKVYATVDTLMSDEGFGVTSVETSGDGLDQIVGVPEEKIMKILSDNLDASTFFKVNVRKDDEK